MSFNEKDQKECWQYTYDKMHPLLEQMEDDFRIYLGDQYSDKEKAALARKGKPSLVINIAKKPCDLLSGFQRQNWADLKCLPIEGADEQQADVYSQLFKWIFSTQGASHYVSQAFDDAQLIHRKSDEDGHDEAEAAKHFIPDFDVLQHSCLLSLLSGLLVGAKSQTRLVVASGPPSFYCIAKVVKLSRPALARSAPQTRRAGGRSLGRARCF